VNQLVWRLHRHQAYFALGALAALTILLVITGTVMANDYHVFLHNCAAAHSCGITGRLYSGDGAILDIVGLTLVAPLLFGLFWGAPLLAKEFEDGTHNLTWTQGVTRRRWLSTNVLWALTAATVWGAVMTLLVTWWRFPENAIDTRFGAFDIQGIVPVAYSVFAVALGIAAGSVLRRVLPAIATTVGVFVAVRALIAFYARPHYVSPITHFFPLTQNGGPSSGAWIISSGITGPHGQYFGNSFSLADVPSACRSSYLSSAGGNFSCLASRGFRQLVTYQPAGRFWTFQGIEAGIYLLLTIALIAFTYRWVLARDA
jgi:hypothetical protein